jgi:hypothetical protein
LSQFWLGFWSVGLLLSVIKKKVVSVRVRSPTGRANPPATDPNKPTQPRMTATWTRSTRIDPTRPNLITRFGRFVLGHSVLSSPISCYLKYCLSSSSTNTRFKKYFMQNLLLMLWLVSVISDWYWLTCKRNQALVSASIIVILVGASIVIHEIVITTGLSRKLLWQIVYVNCKTI